MPKKKRKLIVIGKVRKFDEARWKRLLTVYAYYLHEQRLGASTQDHSSQQAGGDA